MKYPSMPFGTVRAVFRTVFALLLLVAGTRLSAQEGATDEMLGEEGDDYIQLLCERQTTLKSNGEKIVLEHRRLKVLRPAAIEYLGEVLVSYNSYRSKAKFVRGSTILPDGRELQVDAKSVRDAQDAGMTDYLMYEDVRELSFSMPAVRVGAILDYEVETRYHRPVLKGEVSDTFEINAFVPTVEARYVVTAPKKMDLLIRPHHTDAQPKEEQNFLTVTREWTFENLPKIEYEPGMPPYYEQQTAIDVTTLRSWKPVQEWYVGLSEKAFALSDEAREKIAELTADKPTEAEKIRALFLFMQRDIRYVGIELGLSAYQPHPAADCFRNRYGDCKDQAVLLTAMLRHLGIESYVALVRASGGDVDQDFPDVGQFDHAIVYVPRPDRPLWLDATGKYLDEASHPLQLDGTHALIIGAAPDVTFLTIEPPDPKQSCERTAYTVDLMADGFCRVSEAYEYTGRAGADSRVEFENLDQKEHKETLEDYGEIMGTLVSSGNSDPYDLSAPFREWIVYECDDFFDPADTGYSLDISGDDDGWMLSLPEPEKQPGQSRATRVHPWVNTISHGLATTYVIQLPPGVSVDKLPPPYEAKLPQGTLRITVSAEGNTVTAEVWAELRPCTISAADYDSVRIRTDRAISRAASTVTLTDEVSKLHNENKPEEARALAARLVAENPDNPEAHLALASVCHYTGRLLQARKEYRKALELDPQRLGIYQSLAQAIGGFDGVYGEGYDREKVVALARQAVEHARDHKGAMEFLADCLERDEDGELFSDSVTDFSAAIAVYEQMLKEDPEDLDPLSSIAQCHFQLKDYAKAEECYKRMLAEDPEDEDAMTQQWVCAACLGRIDETIAAVSAAYSDDESRVSALDQIAGALLDQRAYPAMLEVMDSRLAILDDDEDIKKLRELVVRLTKIPVVDNATCLDLSSPEGVLDTFLAAVFTQDHDRVLRCLSPRADREGTDPDAMEAVGDMLGAGFASDFILDMCRALWTHKRTDLPGGIVQLDLEIADDLVEKFGCEEAKQAQALCEKMADGTWRICCMGDPDPPLDSLARLALSFLQEGKPDVGKHYATMIQRKFLQGRKLLGEPELSTELADLKYPDTETFVKAMVAASLRDDQTESQAKGNEPTGLRFARELAAKMPDALPIQRVLADHLYASEHYGESLAVREAIAKANPKDRLNLLQTMATLRKLYRYRDALATTTQLGEIMPAADAVGRIKLGVLIEAGETKEGLQLLDELKPRWDDTPVRLNEIRLRAMAGDRKQLLALVNEAADDDSEYYVDTRTLVLSLRQAGLHHRALELAEMAVSSETSPEMLVELCSQFLLTGDTDEARDVFDRLYQVRVAEGDDAHRLGCLGIGLGRFAEAEQLFADCLKKLDVDSRTYAELFIGASRALRGETATAKEAIARASAWQYDDIWPKPVLQYFAGTMSFEDMIANAKQADTPVRRDQFLCEAYFYAAIQARMEGNEARYRELLKQSADTRSYLTMECSIAHGLLGVTVPPDGE